MRNTKLIAALMLGVATATLGPVGCKMAGQTEAIAGTSLGIDPAMMDKSVKPGDDFYGYANGNWQKTTEIPADRSSIGGFFIASEATDKQLGDLIGTISKSTAAADTDEGRIRDFYNTYMDTARIDAAGMAPIKPDLDRIAAIADVKGLSQAIGANIRADVDPLNATNFQTENLFGVFVTQALAGGEVVPYILQGGLGMPEREYYLSPDPKMVEIRTAYRAYIEELLGEAGIADAAARAQRIFDLETKIAQAHATRAESEDFQKSSSEWSKADFAARAPGIDWDALFGAAQLGNQQKFAAYHAQSIPRLSALVASQPLDAWKDWLTFHAINANADVLPGKLDAARFDFYGKTLQGTKEQRPRDKRALAAVNTALGDALGKLYVGKYFPASSKAGIEAMVGNIKTAFATRVAGLDWLAPDTRKEALEKVKTIEVAVGYPDSWKDYGGLKVTTDNAYANKRAGGLVDYAQQLSKIGKPLNKREWWMNAQLVNAVNLPVQNALNFP
ncbi:MAG: M13 family metallopeptidase, partial [Sphingomonadales bacterium]|nr:M13 family metallopeptidase [Sphingomonadales bacterium]